MTKIKFSFLFLLVILFSFSCLHRKKMMPPGRCCVASGSLVSLGDGSYRFIEALKAGDTILAFDRNKNTFVPSRVKRVFSTEHGGFLKLIFSPDGDSSLSKTGNTELIISADHPVWVKEKGWCSVEPEMTKRIQNMKDVKQLKKGDVVFSISGLKQVTEKKLVAIDKVGGAIKAYTVVELESGLDCFIANGIVVGTEPRQMEESGD